MDSEERGPAKLSHALPGSCFLPSERGMMLMVQSVALPELRKIMTDKNIIAAHNGEQPYLDQMKRITCRGCSEEKCLHNPRFHPLRGSEPFALMSGRSEERMNRGEKLLSQLVNSETRARLKGEGVEYIIYHMLSRRNPKLVFIFKPLPPKEERSVTCEVGKAILWVNGKSQPMDSFSQLEETLEQVITSLS